MSFFFAFLISPGGRLENFCRGLERWCFRGGGKDRGSGAPRRHVSSAGGAGMVARHYLVELPGVSVPKWG